MKKLIVIISILLTVFISYSQDMYYVSSSTGDNGNTGLTELQAWETLVYAEANATTAGDTIALKKGDTFITTSQHRIFNSGSSSYDRVYDGSLWGTGNNAIIQRSNAGYTVILIVDCRYLTFQNITVSGGNYNNYGIETGGDPLMSGYDQNNEHHITIQDCEIIDCGAGTAYSNGIQVRPYYNDISNITIQRNVVNGVNSHGITLYPYRSGGGGDGVPGVKITDSYIGYNTITNFREYTGNAGEGIQLVNNLDNIIVEHNTITHATARSFNVSTNEPINGYFPTNVIVRYNTFTCGGNNLSVRVAGGQAISINFYSNLINGSGGTSDGAVYIEGSADPYTDADIKFYNNTIIVNNQGCAIRDNSGIAGVVKASNNILYVNHGTQYCIWSQAPMIASNNLYYRTSGTNLVYDGSYYTASNITDWDANAEVGDPLFTTNFTDLHLQATSPAIGEGIAISGVTLDYDGDLYLDPRAIGAYEFGSGPPVDPVTKRLMHNGKVIMHNGKIIVIK